MHCIRESCNRCWTTGLVPMDGPSKLFCLLQYYILCDSLEVGSFMGVHINTTLLYFICQNNILSVCILAYDLFRPITWKVWGGSRDGTPLLQDCNLTFHNHFWFDFETFAFCHIIRNFSLPYVEFKMCLTLSVLEIFMHCWYQEWSTLSLV